MKAKHRAARLFALLLTAAMLAGISTPAFAALSDQDSYGNVALDKAVSVTSQHPEPYYQAQYLTDGVYTTYNGADLHTLGWTSNPADETTPVDITVDLGGTYIIDKMILKPMQWSKGEGFPAAYQLQVSMDGTKWDTVSSDSNVSALAGSDTEVTPKVYTFQETKASYVRIHITQHSAMTDAGTGMAYSQIGEFEVYGLPEVEASASPTATPAESPDPTGSPDPTESPDPTGSPSPAPAPPKGTNFALGQSISATSDYIAPEGFYSAQFLVDGSWETLEGANVKLGWNTDTAVKLGETDPVDITLTLDGRYALEQIVLKPMKWGNGDAFPRDYELQVSMDGKSWQTIASDTDVNAHAESNTAVQPLSYSGFDAVYLRYFRIHITRHSAIVDQSGAYTSAIGEIELYGAAAPYGKASLQAKLDEIQKLDLTAYTLASLAPLQNAIAAAEALLSQPSPSEADIADAVSALDSAQAELVEKPAESNFALNQSISATSDYIAPEGFYSAKFLVDGSWETLEGSNVKLGWNTDTAVKLAETDPVDITLSLDSSYALQRIVLKPMKWGNGDAFPRDYELQVSMDGEKWQTIASDTNVDAHAESNTAVQPLAYDGFDPVRIRYFRIHITRHSAIVDQSGAYTSAIGEIELYGYEDGAEIVPTTVNKPELLMNPGETDELYLVADRHLPAPVTRYESSNPAVATVSDDGVVTAVANGSTVITLYDETSGESYTATVTVQRYCASDHFQIVGFIPYFYEKDINATTFDNMKKGGLTNVEINFSLDAGAITYENNLKAIKLAHERGLDVTVSEADFNRNWPQKTDEEILAFAKRYSHIPGVTGYYIVDEPADARPYARAMALVKSVMPYAVAHMNFCGAYGDNVRGLVSELNKYGSGLLDYVMYDVYCCRGETVDENSLYYWLEYNRQLGEELNTPTASYIQSMAWGTTGSGAMCNRPDADEIRYQAYASLAYGVKQLSYFCWQTPRANTAETYGPAIIDIDGNPTDLFEPVSEINHGIQMLGPTLMKLDGVTVYHTGDNFGSAYQELPAGFFLHPVDWEQNLTVSHMTEKGTGRTYAMVVNRDYRSPQTVRFTVEQEVASLHYISSETGKPVALTPDADGVYSVELLAGEGILLQLPEDYQYELKDITNFYRLNALIQQAEAIDLAQYREEGRDTFRKALADAKDVAAHENATQAQVDEARAALSAAMSALRVEITDSSLLSLKKPISADNSYEEGVYFSRNYLTDGVHADIDVNSHQGWSTDPFSGNGETDPIDITVDLGDEYLLDTVILRPCIYDDGGNFPRDYVIQVSTDNQNWTDVASAQNIELDAATDQPYAFDYIRGRYVRIHITRHSATRDGGTGAYLSQIGELEVYGIDIPHTDKSALEAAIHAAESTATDGYTQETVDALNAALEAARKTLQNPAASQTAIDEAVAELKAAIENLASADHSSATEPSGVTEPSGATEPSNATKPTETANPSSPTATTSTVSESVQTGDTHPILLWIIAAAVSLVAAALCLLRALRKAGEEK